MLRFRCPHAVRALVVRFGRARRGRALSTFVIVATLSLVAVLTRPSLIAGQAAPARVVPTRTDVGSLWAAVTVGAGSTRLSCDICQTSRDLGPAVELSVGAYASERLRVGLEFGGWTHNNEETRETSYRAGVLTQMSPNPNRGLYLVGGFGWTGYRAGDFRYNAPRVSAGIGWDLPVAERWVIGNQLVLDAAALGSLKNGDIAVARGVGLSSIRLSIQIRRG